MWLYRLIHSARESFPYWLMALLIGQGVLAFLMMFTFPPGSLAMVFIGLITLVLSGVVRSVLELLERTVARLIGITIEPTENGQDSSLQS